MKHVSRPRVLFAAVLVLLAILPAAASAGPEPAACGQPVSQPFLRWLDPGRYFLAPDGGFESGASGWALAGGAAVAGGNEPWHVAGAADGRALALPPGAAAVSPPVCVGLADPTTRLFVRNTAPLGLGVLVVSAEVRVAGLDAVVPVGVVVAGSGYGPTLPLPLLANLTAPLSSGGAAEVRLRFLAVGGSWQVDDVYVDPFRVG